MASWNVKPSGGDGGSYEKPPAGNHPAVLVAIIDLGTQRDRFAEGGKEKWDRKAAFVWELVSAKVSGTKGTNHTIAAGLTVSLHEKATLRKFIQARMGKKLGDDSYDIAQELGKPCLLSVVLNSGGYPKVDGVAAVPAGLPFPEPQNKPVLLTLDDIRNGAAVPEWVPYLFGRPVAEHVAECRELAGEKAASSLAGGTMGGPIPF